MPPAHPPEFRQRAIELARADDRSIGQVAMNLGISESCLRNWLARADIDNGRREGAIVTWNRADLPPASTAIRPRPFDAGRGWRSPTLPVALPGTP
ncbi:transposase [Nocardia vinacea]